MNLNIRYLFCLICIALPAVAAQPDERNCTQAIAEAQKTLQAIPAKTPRDKEDLRKLNETQEKLITEGRRKGMSECDIWGKVMGNAFNQ